MNSTTKNITSTYITDPDVFIQADSAFYNDAYLVYWASGNGLTFKKITSYDSRHADCLLLHPAEILLIPQREGRLLHPPQSSFIY